MRLQLNFRAPTRAFDIRVMARAADLETDPLIASVSSHFASTPSVEEVHTPRGVVTREDWVAAHKRVA